MKATNAVCIETDEYLPKIFPEVSLVSIWGRMINFKNWYNLEVL